jgi:hypothetical protein
MGFSGEFGTKESSLAPEFGTTSPAYKMGAAPRPDDSPGGGGKCQALDDENGRQLTPDRVQRPGEMSRVSSVDFSGRVSCQSDLGYRRTSPWRVDRCRNNSMLLRIEVHPEFLLGGEF